MGTATREATTTTELEARLDIDSLDLLHAKRRKFVNDSAHLRSMHGHNGLFDAARKRLLEALKVRHRMEMTQRGEKTTDSAVDAAAHADPQYEKFLDNANTDRIAWIRAENDIADITDRIQNRTMEIAVFNSEARLR